MRLALCLCLVLVASVVDARRTGGGGSRSSGRGRGSSTSTRHRTPPPPPPPPPSHSGSGSSNQFLNIERGQQPHTPAQSKPPTQPHTNGPIGFEGIGSGTSHGNQKIGFDKVNSEVQNKPGGSHIPSAPQYPGGSHVPGAPQYPGGSHVPGAPQYPGGSYTPHNPQYPGGPPPYSGTHTGNSYGGANDHPPAYPGRPVNAPPTYSANPPNYGQAGQHNSYQGQQNFGYPNYGNMNPQQNHFGYNPGSYSGYPGQGGGASFGSSYPGNTFGGSPFGSTGHNNNPYYSSNNFGYSSNPGYFGHQGGYSGYPGQYDNYQKKSRFGGLPIPIPIPIPIPFGGGGFGSGYGGHGGSSYHHRLLDTFVTNKNTTTATGNSTMSVFILNNSTVTPCTTDHFVYDPVKITVDACTAEHCTGIKVSTVANVSNVVSVHSGSLTMCLENNATFTYHGDILSPTVSQMQQETRTVCRDVPANATVNATKSEEATTALNTTTTEAPAAVNTTAINSTVVCEQVDCYWVEMCLPTVEVVDNCVLEDCPFRRTGYKPCVTIKMCRSPTTPVSTFASINTTISKINEYNNHNSVYHASNLTLISYHRPVISFNCSQNATGPGCAPPPVVTPTQLPCLPANSTQPTGDVPTSPANATVCVPPVSSTTVSDAAATTVAPSSPPP